MLENRSILIVCTVIVLCKLCTAYTDQTVEIVELSIPRYPKAGDEVHLTCHFRLGGSKHRLYTVNWWRGKDQFYTFKQSPVQLKHSYKFKGINVMQENSSEDTVILQKVSEETSGLYKCEVMGEGPAFRTAVDAKRMTVIVPPERLEITHKDRNEPKNIYRIDDHIDLNCTAYKVKPRPYISWKINGIEVSRTEMKRYPDLEDHRGLVTATLALRFLAARYFINRRAKISCLVEVQGHEFLKEEELRLNPSAAFDLYSSGGWRRSIRWYIISILLLVSINHYQCNI